MARVAGFSLFELVVFIITVAIIYASAANRFAAFPVEAEKANLIAITTQLQSAINMEMLLGVGFGNMAASAQMAGMNPMDFLLEAPSNYLGVFSRANAEGLERRSWYFDSGAGELIYRVSGENRVALLLAGNFISTAEIRFKIIADYSNFEGESGLPAPSNGSGESGRPGSGNEKKFTGVVLRPIVPFRWLNEEERQLL
jgi:hypothetical protein